MASGMIIFDTNLLRRRRGHGAVLGTAVETETALPITAE
jgi:hypothetical protein